MSTERARRADRHLAIWSLVVILGLTGCTRVPRPSSWRSSGEERVEPATPKVSANAGSAAGHAPLLEIPAEIADDRLTEVETDAAVARLDSLPDLDAVPVAAASESRVQQLRQALSADARRPVRTDGDADAQSPLRLRIDALLRKSSQQRDNGQLAEAKSTAQRAVDLADEAQLSFLPTELRPTDLLRQMTDALDRTTNDGATIPVAAEAAPAGSVPLGRSLTLPVMLETRDSELTLGHRREDGPPHALGQVAANRPMQLTVAHSSDEDRDAPALPTIELPAAEIPIAHNDAPTMSPARREELVRGRDRAAGPGLALPDRAPESPSIDPLKPLPKFRSSDRPAKPVEIVPLEAIPLPGVGLRGWSLWGPVLSLGAILAVLGLGLLARHLRVWRLAK